MKILQRSLKMKLFSEYLAEAEKKGTYAKMELGESSRKKLYNWCNKNKIENLIEPEEYHVTVAYSRKSVPQISKLEPELPIKCKFIGWENFGGTLVLKIENSELNELHDETCEMGASYDYDEYIPHISVAKNFTGEVPNQMPKFSIILKK